jgi:sulfite exporter TauE/SafE
MTPALLAGVVATSIVGSVHCIAMCGPLVGLHGGTKTVRLASVHALGRLTTYALLGVLAGLVGSAVDLAGRVGNLQRLATLVAAAALVGIGVLQIVAVRVPRTRVRKSSAFTAALVQIRPRSAVRRAWLLGTLTGLLPCGWLWAFVIAAAGTASAVGGLLVMTAFWIGTVPAMVGLMRFAGPAVERIRARMPAVTAIALIAIGLGTLALRWRDAGVVAVEAPHCHDHPRSSS